jgi:antitoxin (DNA-binding transcriptional repressor) of toxin-antitoxin stability system
MGQQICLGQLKSHACDYLDQVSAGGTLEIIRRGRLAALIVPESAFSHEPPDANIPLSSLRSNAAPYFDRVAEGQILGIVRRGSLVARIMALTTPGAARL